MAEGFWLFIPVELDIGSKWLGRAGGSHGERLDVEGQWRRVPELFIPAELGYREQNKAIACVKKDFIKNNSYYY